MSSSPTASMNSLLDSLLKSFDFFNPQNRKPNTSTNQRKTPSSHRQPTPKINLLGHNLPPPPHPSTLSTIYNLPWYTYRSNFHALSPYPFTCDSGWGCMLRSGQMLLCFALRVHLHLHHRDNNNTHDHTDDGEYEKIQTLFADHPFPSLCPFSIHELVRIGLRYDKFPGEWVGPQGCCLVLGDLVQGVADRDKVNEEENNRIDRAINISPQAPCLSSLHVFTCKDSTIYTEVVDEFMISFTTQRVKEDDEPLLKPVPSSSLPPDNDNFDPLLSLPSSPKVEIETKQGEEGDETQDKHSWSDHSLLLLIPVRLGLKSINPKHYCKNIKKFFEPDGLGCEYSTHEVDSNASPSSSSSLSSPSSPSSPSKLSVEGGICLGFLGGRPRRAGWFYGYNNESGVDSDSDSNSNFIDDDSKDVSYEEYAKDRVRMDKVLEDSQSHGGVVYAKDPHITQTTSVLNTASETEPSINFTQKYKNSLKSAYNSQGDQQFQLNSVDPSMSFGIYFRTREAFFVGVEKMKLGICIDGDGSLDKRLFSIGSRPVVYNDDFKGRNDDAVDDVMMVMDDDGDDFGEAGMEGGGEDEIDDEDEYEFI